MAHNHAWRICAESCDGEVDWQEGYFICPHCGEPIYDCDWANADYYPDDIDEMRDYLAQCPICGEIIEEA